MAWFTEAVTPSSLLSFRSTLAAPATRVIPLIAGSTVRGVLFATVGGMLHLSVGLVGFQIIARGSEVPV